MYKRIIKTFLFTVLFIWFGTILASGVYAISEFDVTYDIEYKIDENQTTSVSADIGLINRLTEVYAKEYSLVLGHEAIREVSGTDKNGLLTIDTKTENEKTVLVLKFNEKVVGQGKTLLFNLKFKTNDYVDIKGKIKQVNIPLMDINENVKSYYISVSYPSNFKKPTLISPKSKTPLFWTLDELKNTSSIRLAFGDIQYYSFNLTYNLINNSLKSQEKSIAIPPDTAYQQIYLNQINPEPEQISYDVDGNWLAFYKLLPQKRLRIQVSGFAKVFNKPQDVFVYPLTEDKKNIYLAQQEFWEVNDQKIIDLSKKIPSAKKIYNYIINNFSYDYSRILQQPVRLGARKALEYPDRLICMEFSDLFVTLSRASKIPSREIEGYALTNNKKLKPLSLIADLLHSWAEYYDMDSKTWVAVDPTWARTTGGIDYFNEFDFDHLAFVIHGVSSTQPLPAGAYKTDYDKSRDVQVDIVDAFPNIIPEDPQVKVKIADKFLGNEHIGGELLFINTQPIAQYNLEVLFNSLNLKLKENKIILFQLPPKAQISIPFEFESNNKFFGKNKLTATFRGKEQSFSFEVKQTQQIISPLMLALVLAIFILGTIFFILKVYGKNHG